MNKDERRAAAWPDNAIAEGALIMGLAQWVHGAPRKRIALFSGGLDSLTTTWVAMEIFGFDSVAHIETGTGIQSTTEHVRMVCEQHGWPLTVYHPPLDKITGRRGLEYQAMVAGLTAEEVEEIKADFEEREGRPMEYWETRRYNVYEQKGRGFPGPGAHGSAYNRLKERALRDVRRDNQEKNGQRIWFASGVRSQESSRRMAHVHPVQKEGAVVWVAPIWRWTKLDCHANATKHGLEMSPASMFIGMSGECLCGAFAKQGELEKLATMFPDAVKPLVDLEALAVSRGIKEDRMVWRGRGEGKPGIMCVGCESDPKVAP